MSKNSKKIKFKIRAEDLHIRNEMHFEIQKNTRAQVFKSKKGKGSYTRKQKYKNKDNC